MFHLIRKTIFFLQPERVEPPDPMNPDYDVRADVWSFGISLVCLFIVMLTTLQIFQDNDLIMMHIYKKTDLTKI